METKTKENKTKFNKSGVGASRGRLKIAPPAQTTITINDGIE